METWLLQHPEQGRIEVKIGTREELLAGDQLLPELTATGRKLRGARLERFADAIPVRQARDVARSYGERMLHNQARSMLVLRNGEVLARVEKPRDIRVNLTKPQMVSKEDQENNKRSWLPFSNAEPKKPQVEIRVGALRDVTSVYYKNDTEVLALTPSEGSFGARREAAMRASSWKRTMYPILTGMGKAGWAIFMFIILPLLGKLWDWLKQFLPDTNIPWPDIHIPWPHVHIPWPHIHIPWPHFHIPWPDIHIPIPHIHLPDWLLWLIDHPKMWIPIVAGIGIGIMALRNHKKSEATKQEWRAKGIDTTPHDPARTPQAVQATPRAPEVRHNDAAGTDGVATDAAAGEGEGSFGEASGADGARGAGDARAAGEAGVAGPAQEAASPAQRPAGQLPKQLGE